MGIPICTYNSCCEKNNVILQTHSVYRKENSSKIIGSNSKSHINKSINENMSQNNNNSLSKSDSISESKSDEESDSEERQKKFDEKLYKIGILRNDNITLDGKEKIDCICIESYNKSNNFFYYLKKVKLIQNFYKKYYKKNHKKKKSKKLELGKLHVNFFESNDQKKKIK